MTLPFPDHPAMHEALFDDRFLKDTGVSTLDFAKAMIDEGFHPMTVYFPLVVHGAMLIEPTESESRASLDLFIADASRSRLCGEGRQGRALPRSPALCPAPPPRRDARRAPAGAEVDAARAVSRRRRSSTAADATAPPFDGRGPTRFRPRSRTATKCQTAPPTSPASA